MASINLGEAVVTLTLDSGGAMDLIKKVDKLRTHILADYSGDGVLVKEAKEVGTELLRQLKPGKL